MKCQLLKIFYWIDDKLSLVKMLIFYDFLKNPVQWSVCNIVVEQFLISFNDLMNCVNKKTAINILGITVFLRKAIKKNSPFGNKVREL